MWFCPRSPDTLTNPSASFIVMLFASFPFMQHMARPHRSAHEPKPVQELHPNAQAKDHANKTCPKLLKHKVALCNSSRCSGLKYLSCGIA
jgi:hypothetical protein